MNNIDRKPYLPPDANVDPDITDFVYVGFWARVGATLIDTVIIFVIVMPVGYGIYGSDNLIYGTWDFLITYIFPAAAVIVLWRLYSATPGKMVIGAKIADARTGDPPSVGQLIGRYLAYYPSFLVLGLGCFWVGWDPRKQGWHDKLAKTVVVRRNKASTEPLQETPRDRRNIAVRIVFSLLWLILLIFVIHIVVGVIVGAMAGSNVTTFEEGAVVGEAASVAFFSAYGQFVYVGELVLWLLLSVLGMLPGTAKYKRART